MTHSTSLIGRLRKILGMGPASTTPPPAFDPTQLPPAEQPALPSSEPKKPVGPTLGWG
jgi:hypothetical protein